MLALVAADGFSDVFHRKAGVLIGVQDFAGGKGGRICG